MKLFFTEDSRRNRDESAEKWCCMLLAVVMLAAVLPTAAFAADEGEISQTAGSNVDPAGNIDADPDSGIDPAGDADPAGNVDADADGDVDPAGDVDPVPVNKNSQIDEQTAAVIDMIEMLKELTPDMEEQVLAARAAYDALSEEQKAQVENLALLEEAEAAFAALRKADPRTVSIPEETCTVDYSKRQSAGVTYDGCTNDGNGSYTFNYTVTADAGANPVIDLAYGALDLWQYETQLPGDHFKFRILIRNESGHVYQYKDGSFVLAPEDTDQFGSLADGSLLPVLTYDGQYMPIQNSGAVLAEYFYKDIFGVSSSANVTFEMLCQIYDYLEKAGYTGETAMSDYLLNYFNGKRGTSYGSLTELFADHSDWLDGELVTRSSVYKMTQEQLEDYIARYPWIDRFVYAKPSGGKYDVQLKWPEPEISAVSWNSFYMGLFSVVYGEENANYLNPNPSGDLDFARSHGVGDYLSGTALYAETNAYFKGLTAEPFKDGDTLEIWSGYGIDGPGMGNSYNNYSFTYYNIIELEQLDTTYTVRHDYYTDGVLNGSVTTALDGTQTEDVLTGLVGDVIKSADAVRLTGYQGNTYSFTSEAPAEGLTLILSGPNELVLRYDRSTIVPYIVIHQYYTDGVLTGTYQTEGGSAKAGTVIQTSSVPLATVYGATPMAIPAHRRQASRCS